MTSSEINKLFIQFSKRAEKIDREMLISSFVDVGPLLTALSVVDNQILYGRRGTGKTHALVYLSEEIRNAGNMPLYIDFRNFCQEQQKFWYFLLQPLRLLHTFCY